MTNTKHTAIPWKLEQTGYAWGIPAFLVGPASVVGKENAEFIVRAVNLVGALEQQGKTPDFVLRAVNSHEMLVNALNEARSEIIRIYENQREFTEEDLTDHALVDYNVVFKCIEALKLATE